MDSGTLTADVATALKLDAVGLAAVVGAQADPMAIKLMAGGGRGSGQGQEFQADEAGPGRKENGELRQEQHPSGRENQVQRLSYTSSGIKTPGGTRFFYAPV